MRQLKTSIRILVLVCFLAPFITCHNNILPPSSATADSSASVITSSLGAAGVDGLTTAPSPVTNSEKQTTSDKILEHILYPTENSVSGFGCIAGFPEFPGVLTAVIFFLSFITIFPWRFLQVTKRRTYISAIKLVCLLLFIGYILSIKDMSILWGTWVLLLLLITELLLDFNTSKSEISSSVIH